MLKLNHLTGFGSGAAAAAADVTSYVFDGTGDYLGIPDHADWSLSTGDFCFEAFVRLNGTGNHSFFELFSDSDNYLRVRTTGSGANVNVRLTAASVEEVNLEPAHGVSYNTWFHLAVTKNSSDRWDLWIDGTTIANATNSTSIPDFTSSLYIGEGFSPTSSALGGYMDEIRISDTVRYTTTFTPTTTQFVSDANTKLLIHGGEAYTGALTGETTQSCVTFVATGDYLSVPDHADWDFSTGNWTLECFANMNDVTDRNSLIVVDGYTTGIQWNYDGTSSVLKAYVEGTEYTFTFTPTNNTWHHFALVRNGNDLLCFADGVQKGSTEDITGLDLTGLSNGIKIGSIFYATDLWDMDGKEAEVRISDIARYTSGFTPATERFTSDANTLLLIHGDENGGGTAAFTDSGNTGHTVTPTGGASLGNGGTFTDSGNTGHTVIENGQAQKETEQEFKFTDDGVGYSLAGGATDYLSVPDHDDWTFGSGNFTAECWMRLRAIQTGSVFQHEAASNDKWYLRFKSDIGLHFQASDTSDIVDFNQADVASWQINRWYHVAVIRGWNGNANDWAITRDGVPVATVTDASSLQGLTASLLIGRNTGAGSTLDAYLDEIRISDIARWTADFSASLPSAQYSSDANTLLLIHGGETKSGTTGSGATFTDSGNTGHTVTENGNAIESTGNLYKF
jgi:hypothetical protein